MKCYKSLIYILFAVGVLFSIAMAGDQDGDRLEYEIKAAFLVNFAKFSQWPAAKEDINKPIFIGVIGLSPFSKEVTDALESKKVNERTVKINSFAGYKEHKKLPKEEFEKTVSELQACHILFICQSESDIFNEINEAVSNSSVMTVSDIPGFVDAGGIINFVIDNTKVGFEVNVKAATDAKIEIRSQMLRVAKNNK